MNETVITVRGWVGSEVTLATTPGGARVAALRMGSTPRRRRGEEWADAETLWFAVKAWDGLGEHVAASVHRGDPVLVTGRLVAESWRREDGSTATRQVLVARSVGHDLAHGTATFTRAAPPRQAPERAA